MATCGGFARRPPRLLHHDGDSGARRPNDPRSGNARTDPRRERVVHQCAHGTAAGTERGSLTGGGATSGTLRERPDVTDPYRIELLARTHDHTAFVSGESQIDDWFHTQAGQASRRGIATVHVMVNQATGTIIGFYTLSNFTVLSSEIPSELGKALPDRIPLPAHLIGQLAVDAREQGKRYGGALLLNALHRAQRMTAHSASLAVVVHAINAQAAAWYTRYNFLPFPAHPLHLLMPMKDITRLFPLPPSDASA
jgi:GNAT superfamily N-acetyltransferase